MQARFFRWLFGGIIISNAPNGAETAENRSKNHHKTAIIPGESWGFVFVINPLHGVGIVYKSSETHFYKGFRFLGNEDDKTIDGNKRIGIHIMLTFLELNGIKTDCSDADIVNVGLGVASGKLTYEALLTWVKEHRKD